jgi:Kef-type K+ transport system membrane component KefB
MTFLPDWPNATDPLLLFSILLLAGLAAGELVQRALRLPRITGYVLVGALVGLLSQRVFGRPLMEDARLFADIALGLVLFELGRRFDFAWLKRDRWLMATGLAESAVTFATVYGVLNLLDFHAAWAAVAAAIAMATSPAVIMLVVRDTRSEGQVTERALCFTALNCIAAGITTTMLLSWLHLEYKSGWMSVVLHPLYLLVGAGVAAWVLARLLILTGRWCGKRETAQFVLLVGTVILAVGVAEMLKLSVLLTLLLLGMLSRNLDRHHALLNIEFGYAAQPFFVILFVVTGAGLTLADLEAAWLPALAYVAARFLAKTLTLLALGPLNGFSLDRAWLTALALTPMTGVAVILVRDTTSFYPQLGTPLASTVLTAIALLDLIGPIATQLAFRRAGESHPEEPRHG